MPAVRAARPADAAALAAIDARVNLNPWTEQQFIAACSGLSATSESALLVDVAGLVGGFVVFSQVLDEASIHSIAVHPAHQGRGLGRLLLHAVLEHMLNAGAVRCLLEVRQSNTIALRLYTANGFELDGVRKNYYPTGEGREDALLMSRKLLR